MRRLVISVFVLLLWSTPVGAWWTPFHPVGRAITALRFERVEPDAAPQGFFDGAWQAAFPAKSQTCDTAARDMLVKAKRDDWDVDTQAVIDATVAFMVDAGEHSPCYAVLYLA